MENKDVLKKYGKYADILDRVGKLPLWKTPTLDDMRLSKAEIQMTYRELKGEGFHGTVLDYLCTVSTDFLVWMAKNRSGEKVARFIIDNYPEYETDTVNFLRLLFKKPWHFTDKLNDGLGGLMAREEIVTKHAKKNRNLA